MKRCAELSKIRILILLIMIIGIVLIEGFLPIKVKGKPYVKTFVIDPDKEFMYSHNFGYNKNGQQSISIEKLSKIDDLNGYYENIGWISNDAIGLIKRNSLGHFKNSQQVSLAYWQINVMNIESRGSSILLPNAERSQQTPIISPDEEKIVFIEQAEGSVKKNKDSDLVLYDIYTNNKETIPYFKPVTWSRDSKYIFGYRNNDQMNSLLCYDTVSKEIYEMKLETGKYINIDNIVVSNDNNTLYFTSNLDPNSSSYTLYKIPLKKGTFTGKTPVSFLKDKLYKFDVLSNGNIIFSSEINGDEGLFICKSDGTHCHKIVDNVAGDFKMSKDKYYIAFYANCNTGGTNLYASRLYKNNIDVPTLIYKFDNITSIYWSDDNSKLMVSEFDSKQKQDITSIIYFKTDEIKWYRSGKNEKV